MTAKAKLLAAARAGGATAVRRVMEEGGPKETLVVRCPWSADLLQHHLTDNNYHSVEIISCGGGLAVLSAPADYDLALIVTKVFKFEVIR